MDLLRVSRDIYGREVLQGMSWDLLPVFFGLGCLLIVGHAVGRWLLTPKKSRRQS
jgi:hypothetical protein